MSGDADFHPEVLSNGDENGSVESSPSKSGSGSPKSIASDVKSIGERSADYHKLIEYGLDEKVAIRLEEIYKTGK